MGIFEKMISVFQCTLSDNKSTWLFGKRLFEHALFLSCVYSVFL